MRAFGEVLADYRERYERRLHESGRHVSARGLARRIGVTHPILGKWERGETRNPDYVALHKLAGLYGLRFDALVRLVLQNRADPDLSFPAAVAIVTADGQEAFPPPPPPPVDSEAAIDRRTKRKILVAARRLAALAEFAFAEQAPGPDTRPAERPIRGRGVRKRASA